VKAPEVVLLGTTPAGVVEIGLEPSLLILMYGMLVDEDAGEPLPPCVFEPVSKEVELLLG